MANTAALEGINGLRDIRRSPASHLAPALEAGSIEGTVVLKEGPFQTMAGVRVDPGSEAGSRIASVVGGLPARCGEVGGTERASVLWLGPSEFLMVAPEEAHDSLGGDLIGSLVAALGDAPGQVVDLSANRTTFELTGPRARAVLEKGCALDLHPRTFTAGTALNTEVGFIPVILLKSGEESYRLFPRASFADFLGRWLLDAMREFASPEVP
ncbi:sarcosine oxidase subunit gamma [Arthrobacter sp. ZBG10]|jgi:sarcosine oxidase subunit gamma|uniref:sarcosine oxidase subunit gamma n=1 Tax=Micrococcaceae TaxID=1268 RepID=UPI0006826A60|nr:MULTISPECIES: sarcosine oxidase subunit gamma family protein [Micrococcaceae]KNH16777.1 sarcosine oxidase subunit gamma [Arthrobacter sp. ZBG10]KQR01248.1 sarcosine oxidase subunit gamma [Arthrobacter sp. Leaf141]